MTRNSRHGDFGRHVRSLRRARNLTQEALAERCGLSTDTIRRLEGCRFSPGLNTLRKIGGGLDLRLSTLFDSYELNERDVDRELAELLAGRSPEERELVYRLARTALAGIDELRKVESSEPPE